MVLKEKEKEKAMKCITYKKGYKYQLRKDYTVQIPVTPEKEIGNEYIRLSPEGNLFIKESYAWDGPSGPTIDTLNFMRGSLVHDGLYQFMREELLDRKIYRKAADKLIRQMCREDGMSAFRAWYVYWGLRIGGSSAADPRSENLLIVAPEGCTEAKS